MGLRDMPPRGGSGAPRLRGWRGFLSAAFRACHALVPAAPTRASGAGGLLLAVLLAALPLQAVAQTQGVEISVSPDAGGQYPSITEGDTATFTLKRTGDNSTALTVQYATNGSGGPTSSPDDTAQEGTDYTGISGSHTFPAGSSDSFEFEVETKEDSIYEPWEYFTVKVSGSYLNQGGETVRVDAEREVRIAEDDERYVTLSPVSGSALGMSHPEFMAKEGGIKDGKNELIIKLNEMIPYDLHINYTVGPDPHTTATSRDFTMTGTQRATIEAGKISQTIDIGIVDDDEVEPTEYFTLRLLAPKNETQNNALPTYKQVAFKDSKIAGGSRLSVSIMDNDTAEMRGVVHLRGEGGGGIEGFPSTRKTLTEGQSTTITAEIAGAAPSSDIQIPLKVTGFPGDEAMEDDYSIPEFITILANQKSGNVTLKITDDAVDERYRELLVVEINDANNFPSGYTKGDRSKYEVVMLDNDKTPVSLQSLNRTALTEARGSGTHTATFQLRIDRRPKAAATGMAPFTDAETEEGNAKLSLEYAGTATRNTDYNSPNEVNIPSSGALPSNCKEESDGAMTCTVTLTVTNDNLYEGGSAGTKETVQINLNAGGSSFNDGIKRASEYAPLKLTIEDNDLQPMFSIADVSGPENGNLTFTVKREGARGNNVSVTADTGDHDGEHPATAGKDYTTVTSKTLRFSGGTTGSLSETFVVAVTDDNIDEHDETFSVKLSNPVDNQGLPKPAIAAGKGTAVGTITDNDDAPTELTIEVNTDTIAEAADPITVTVTAAITSPTRFATDQTVTVTVGNPENEGEASAGAGGDYETVEVFNITIPATEASGKGTFELTPLNDRIDDDDENISVEGALTGMTVTQAAITIVDDDTRGITVSKATLTIDEADDENASPAKEDEGTYEVALTSQPEGGTVTVNVASGDTTVATVDGSPLTFTADNWEMAQVVTVTAQDDTIDNAGNERATTITHTVSAADTDYKDETVGDVTVTVRDDDEAPMALTITVDTDTGADDDQNTIGEGADTPTVRITATLDGDTQFATDQTITITVGDPDKDTATEGDGGDYDTVNDLPLTLTAGAESVSHDLTLTLNNDTVDEPEETVTVAGKLAGVTVKGTSFTIEDNDATPTVTLVLTPASINESGATNASTVTATMDGESSEAVTLTVSATPVDPAVAGDLTLSDTTTLTIPANTQASNGVVTITAVDNDVDAANKTVTVAATATGGNELVAPGNQTLTITDDDTRGITVSKATLTLDEVDNAATMEAAEHQDTYTVVLDSEPSGGTVTIGVASGDTDVATVSPMNLTFTDSNWDEPQTVTVTAVADGIDNPSDRREATISHTVTATGTDYEDATASAVTVTVNDDDGPSTLSINSPSVTEVDHGATATLTFTVRLAPESGNTVTVDYADTGDGTATTSMGVSGPDYETLVGDTLTFAPGVTSQSVAVTVRGDDIDELDETVVVRLSSPSNATLTGGATTLDGTGTINDNDDTPTVSVADAADVPEGNVAAPNPANNMTFAVTLSAVSGLDVTVPYTLAGTATAGTDYTEPDPRSVMIAAGQTQANIAIPVAGDEVDEENETITVTLGTPTNATVSTAEGAGAASGTITDDDTRGVSVTPTTLTVAEADNAGTAAIRENEETYEVVLTSQPTGAVTVNLTSGDESVARINTASLVFDADDWNTERTVTVTGQPDNIDNTGNERTTTIAHTVSAAGTDYASETAEGVAVTVTDDDAAPSGITLTASPDSVTENGGAKTITVTATVNDETRYAQARTVSVSVGGGTAISGTDYTAVESFDITIGAGEDDASNTFTLTPENDVLAEDDETIEVTGTLSGITITPDEITLTDDDTAPTGITLSVDTNGAEDGAQTSVGEDAGATLVTVTATVNGETRYVDAKTVAVSVADGTAASPADYAAVNNFNITIAAGAASQTGSFTVTPVDDDLDEANETINVTGTLSSVTITGATVTFTDNDDPVSFSIADAEATEGGKVTFMVSRAGAEDNVASVKVTTATDSGDGVNAADADDYTAIATAQTLNFAKDVTIQTVEVQTTQDDLFEPDETFKAVLSAPALGDGDPGTGVSIETGKGTATGTIKNDDTRPSFAVADASASEGDAITFTVTRSGAMDNAVSVKWNTKADSSDGANAASASDYTAMPTATKLDFAKGISSQTFTVATTEDVLDEENETFLVELTGAEGGTIATAEATGTINDDDAAPGGITLSVDTNGSTSGTPSTVAEDAGATVVTVTATVNGTTRYVEAKTVAVSVADGTAASPADYAAVSSFNITIAAGTASQSGVFTVTPVDDDLDEADETIDVTGTLSSVTITDATVTLTDNDDPVSFSIADAEATEGGKVTFTVSRAGAEDNVAEVKIATSADSGDDVNAAGTDDYTAIATARTLNFAKGVASQTVEVQTTQDDLFEPDETFLVNLSAPALADGDPGTGISIESGKGTAIGTIKNDDTQPSFAVADASASEGDAITFTVTRSGAMDNAVSVKWNTKADTGAGAASATDYTAVTTAATLSFAKGVGTQTFTVDTTEDVLHEGDETFLVELTGAEGGTIATAQATGTINDDDDAPSGITLSVDTNGAEDGTPSTVAEDAGATVVTVTATVNGTTRYVEAKTVAVSVADNTAASPADYAAVNNFNITIAAGAASHTGSFTVTPVDDNLDESDETIDVTGTLSGVTVTAATVTLTDTDDPVSFSIADAEATEGGKVAFTVNRAGAEDNVASVKVATEADSGDDVNAAGTDDYTAIATAQTLNFAKGVTSQTVEVQTTQDDLFEPDETFKAVLSAPALADGDPGTGASIEADKGTATGTIKNDDTEPSFAVADASASEGDAITFTVTRSGAMDNAVSVKWNTKAATGAGAASASDYTEMTTATKLDFAKGVGTQTFTVATTEDTLNEASETFLIELTEPVGATIADAEATGTINDDDAAPTTLTLAVDADNNTENVQSSLAENGGAKTVKVTATLGGSTQFDVDKTLTLIVGDDDNSATEGTDYTNVADVTLTIPAGDQDVEHTFTLTPTDDAFREDSETISFDATLTGVTVAGASITLTSDDAAPAITLTVDADKDTDNIQTSLAEDGGVKTVRVTATLDGTTRLEEAADLTLAVGKSSDSAVEGTDYTNVADRTITIGAGVASVTDDFTLTPTNDDLYEGSETISLDGTLTGVTVTDTSLTLTDDDAQPSFAVADASADEGDAITFTVTRSGAMDNVVSVKWNTKAATGNGAAATTDYTAMPTATKLDFAKGVRTQTFTVATTEDTLNEANETFLVELTEAVGGTITTAQATGTITNDDAAPTTLTLAVDADTNTENVQSSLAENGGAKTVKVTATLGGPTQFDVDKTLTLIVGDDGDSATEGTDYTNVADITLTILAGDQDIEHTFTLTPTDDAFREDNETISFDATLTGIMVTGASITLTSEDAAPAITLTVDADKDTDNIQTSLAEDGGVKTVRVTATLDGTTRLEAAADLTLTVGKSSDSATEGTDYTNVADRTITIGAGVASVTDDFTLTPTNDDLYEGSETISLDGTLTGVAVTDTSLTLTDDDAQPSFAVADASAAEGDAITFTVTRSGAMDNAVSVKWNTKAATGAGAASTTDYTAMTTATKLDFAKGVGTQTFTVATTEDTLHEGNETFLVELTDPVGAIISDAEATGTINDDDAAPTGITLTVAPATVGEEDGETEITVTATVNGTTRYVEAKTVAVSVADGTAASPGDYAAVSGFNIIIAAGAASHTGSFTVTPVDDDLDEANETIDVTGTLTDITITGATVTLTDNDDPVSFSIADAEATEGGKVTFTVSRAGAEDNVAEVKIATAADSGDGVKAAGTDDYTAIATAQTLNFAKGVTSQTVEVQTAQDDLFEPDETFRAVLSVPALGENDPGTGVSIESGKGTAIGTIKNDDTQPSFAVADASASEGDAITFTVTRSGAMDNVVSVKWNTKAATGNGAAATTDYTAMTTATKLDFAKGVGSQTFTVATTEDTLHEGNETFLVELTEAEGGTISTAQATGTINDDDDAPTGITLSVDADTGTDNMQTSLAEDGGAKTVRVTATLVGSSTFTEAKTVTVEVGADADGAEEGTDYTEVESKSITIDAGSSSGYVDFTLTPTDDDIDEPSEGISIEGTLTGITVTGTAITLTDDEVTPTVTLVLTPTAIDESGNGNASTVTATLSGKSSVAVTLTVAAVAGADTVGGDFTVTTNKTLTFAAGATTSTGTVTITAVDNDVDAPNKSVTVSAVASGGGVANPGNQTLTINDDEGIPTATLVLDPTAIDESGATNASTVTATLSGKSNEAVTLTVAAAPGADTAAGDFTLSGTTLTIAAGATTSTGTVTITAVDNDIDAPNKSVTVSATASGGSVANPADQTLTITDDEGTPTVTLVLTPTAIDESGDDNASTVTAMLSGKSSATVTVTVSVPNDAPVTLSNNAALSIAAGATTSTGAVTITAVDNNVDAPNKTVTISATASGRDVANPDSQTLTITDDDAAPSGITLSVSPATVGEEDGETEIMVTATVNGTTRYADARTVTVSVGGGTAISGTDYDAVPSFDITIAAGDASKAGTFDLTPTNDVLDEANETINVTGTSGSLTITSTMVTITDDDDAPGAITISVDADTGAVGTQTTIAENGGAKTVRVTATITDATRFVEAKTVTLEVGADADGAEEGTDYKEVTSKSITINAGAASGYVEFTLTPTNDTRHEASETISLDGSLTGLTVTDSSLSITDNDAAPTTLTLTVDADNDTQNVQSSLAENGGAKTVKVTATLGGSTQFDEDKTLTLIVGKNTDSATEGTDYTNVADVTLTIPAGDQDVVHTFTLTPTDDTFHEASETISFDATLAGLTVTGAQITLTSDDAAAAVTLTVDTNSTMQGDQDTLAENAGATSITVTATLSGATRFDKSTDLTLIVGDDDADSATEGTDYTDVANRTITIGANAQTASHTFTLTPTDDAFHEANETISFDATLTGVTVAGASITLTSEDAAPAITLTVDADKDTNNVQTSLAEDGGVKTVRVTATLDGTTRLEEAADLTLAVGKDGDSAVEGTDYSTVADRTITIGAGVASVTDDFTLTPTNDDLHEGSETISLDGTLAGVTVTDATITLTDDDAAPSGITLTVSPATVGEGAGETEITVTATVNGTTRYVDAKTVTVSVGGGTATSDTDYDAVTNFDIIIAAGDASKAGTFDLTPTDDDLHEGSETIDVTGTSGALTITKAEISLTDDDGQPSFAVADASASEGETITFTVTRSGAMDNAVSVKWNTKAATGAGAAATTDYTAMTTATKLDFAMGVSSQTFTVATTEDTLHEGDETFLIELTEPVGAIISDAEATGTITDDDAAPTALTLTVDADTGTMGTQTSLAEDGGVKTVRVTATLGGSSTFNVAKTVTLEVGVDADGATEETDYANVGTQNITIDAGESSGYVDFSLTPTQDVLHEGSETISLDGTLTGVAVTDTSLTLTDDDAAPGGITLTVSPATVGEGAGETEITVTATVNGSTRYVDAKTVTVSVGGGTATSDTDYDAVANFDIIIAAGDASKAGTFDLTPTQDDLHEGSETINLDGTVTGVTVTDASLTLTDDDGQPSFAVADASADEGETITFTVTRSGAMDNAVSVKWNTKAATGAGAAATTDYAAMTTATKLDFASGVSSQTFTVATTEDTLHEGNETFLVELTDPVGAIISDAEATGTITDDDAAPTMLTLSVDADTATNNVQTSLAEDGGAKMVRVTATLGGSSTFNVAKTVAVEIGADADGAVEGTDYANLGTQNITINAGASSGYVDFTLTPTDDDIDEPNEGISIEGTLTDVMVTGTTITLTDDEGTPTVTLVLTPTTINESGGTNSSTVTATLSGESSAAVTVEVSVPNAAPVTLSSNTTLTIAPGSKASTGAVTITAVDNDVDAPNKTVTVSATASGGGVSDPTDQTLTITDDEGTPTVTLVLTPTTINESGNGNASTVTATLSGESSAAVTVEVSVPNNAPVTLSGNTTLTIAAGSKTSTGTVTITAVDNDVDAPNASVVVSGVAAGGGVAVANPGNQTLTITDDEGTPTVTLVLTPTAINESGNGNASTVTATLSGKSNTAVTLTVAAAAGADTVTGDFTVSNNKTLTIVAGATASTGTVKITAVNNNVDAPDKSVTVSATASGGGVTNPDNQTLTITDDDAAPTGITLSVSPATLGEGDGLTQITVTAAVNGTTRYVDARTVTVSVGGGTAISGTDYGAVSNFDITIAAGDASQTGTFDLTPTDDALHEEDETINVTGTSGSLTITPATVTITDNDNAGPAGTVSLSTSRYEVLEGDSLSVTVNLSEAPAADTMIELEATSPGGYSATPGADYDGGVQTVTIRAGTTSGKARISTTRDNQNDPNETFKLTIRASELPGTVTLGEPDTAVVTIREPVSGITPTETATVVYAGRNSRILMPVPAGLKGHGIDVAFYFDWGPGTAQGGGDCREPGTDVVDWGHWPSYPEGMVRTGPLVRIAEDINTDTIELEIELCKGSVGKTFTASWDSLQWLGNPDRGFPGVKSYPFNAAAAHCTSTALCYTRVTIIGDTPDPDPEITIAAGGDITEGGDAVFTVQASPAPASDLEIALAIADDAGSDFLADGDEGSKTVTIAAGSDTATYTLATTDDDLEEANGGVSATLEAGTGYRVGSPSTATVAVADNDGDDDARATVVRITGGADITEGGVARFTLTGTPAPSQDITVNLRVTQSGAFAGDGELGARPVTLGTDATVTVDIPTVDDSTLEDDGSLTIIVEPGTGYTPHATDATATVAVADNEEPTLPTIHIADVEAAEGDDLHFTFTLSHAVDHEVVVYWETRFGANYHNDSNRHGPSYGEAVPHADFRYADSRVTVYPGSTRGEFWVETFDDFHDEGRETLTVVLTEAEGAIIADELAIGTIVNSDPMPAAWLARFGRAVAEQALDGIAGRIAAPRTAGMQGMIAGQALSFGGSTGFGAASPHGSLSGTSLSERARLSLSDIDRLFGDERATDRSRTLSGRDLLLGSRFTLTGERDATGGNLAFWGRAAQSGFDGREGRFSLDGEAMTAMLGADYARDQWLAGMALMRSSGKGGGSYADPGSESGAGSGSVRGAGGKVEATLTAAIPYLALQASERVKLWGALGHGVGEVMLKPELGEMLKSDISWSMASLGLRGDLLPTRESPGSESGAGGPGLALVSDALWAGTSSEKTRGLAASDSDVTRLRLGLEGSWKAPLEGDASIMPKLEMGMRHDGGDAETGFGVELGGGIAWMDPRLGLSLDLSGRALVAHDAGDLENRGFSTSLAFDPDPASERGLSFALRQDWGGQAEGGLDALFQADPLSERTGSGSTSGSRWSAEGAYGFPALSGRFISSPHMGIGLATGARDYSLGWRLTPARNAPDISFGLKATRRESDGAAPEHTLGFEISARW